MAIYDSDRKKYRKKYFVNRMYSLLWTIVCGVAALIIGYHIIKFLVPWFKTLGETIM